MGPLLPASNSLPNSSARNASTLKFYAFEEVDSNGHSLEEPVFFSSFARATWFAIGRQGVLSLAGWTPRIRAHFHVLGPTQVPNGRRDCCRIRDYHPLWSAIPDWFC
jgi:hypothetical protein